MKKGDIVKGRVTAIKPYGAFVKIDESTDGLVHISEVSDNYVKDVEDYLSVGKSYKFEVLDKKTEGKVSLSYKRLHTRKKRLTIHLKSGFKPLRDKLEEWIESYDEDERRHKE